MSVVREHGPNIKMNITTQKSFNFISLIILFRNDLLISFTKAQFSRCIVPKIKAYKGHNIFSKAVKDNEEV